jgi:hypothetical protein
MKCDMCNKPTAPYALVVLLDSYKTKDIEWICGDCEKVVNDHLWKLKNLQHGWVTRIFREWLSNKKKDLATKGKDL